MSLKTVDHSQNVPQKSQIQMLVGITIDHAQNVTQNSRPLQECHSKQ